MNTNNKIHQLHMEQWAARFREQASSGLTVRDWCAENNYTVHNYYYWKRVLKNNYVESVLPDIVPLLPASQTTEPISASQPLPPPIVSSTDLHNLHKALENSTLQITCGDFSLNLSGCFSSGLLLDLIKAVRHA